MVYPKIEGTRQCFVKTVLAMEKIAAFVDLGLAKEISRVGEPRRSSRSGHKVSSCQVVASSSCCFNQPGSPWVAKKSISESPGTPKEIFIGTPVSSPRGGASPLGWPWHGKSEDKIRDSRAGVAIKKQVHGISLIWGQNKTVLNSCFRSSSNRKCVGLYSVILCQKDPKRVRFGGSSGSPGSWPTPIYGDALGLAARTQTWKTRRRQHDTPVTAPIQPPLLWDFGGNPLIWILLHEIHI